MDSNRDYPLDLGDCSLNEVAVHARDNPGEVDKNSDIFGTDALLFYDSGKKLAVAPPRNSGSCGESHEFRQWCL